MAPLFRNEGASADLAFLTSKLAGKIRSFGARAISNSPKSFEVSNGPFAADINVFVNCGWECVVGGR
jgi:hypothetical protein